MRSKAGGMGRVGWQIRLAEAKRVINIIIFFCYIPYPPATACRRLQGVAPLGK